MGKYNLGLIQVFTGNNKGKTTTALGIALRAHGQNLKVCIIQFLKGGAYTGEYIALKNKLPEIEIYQYGKPCIKEREQLGLSDFEIGEDVKKIGEINYIREDIHCGKCRDCFLEDEEQKTYAREAFAHAEKVLTSGDYDIIILDEINICVFKDIIKVEELLDLLDRKYERTEVIMTGRNAVKDIIDRADLVTDMRQIKHYFDKGVEARRGIEY